MKKSIKKILSAVIVLAMTAGFTFVLHPEAATEFVVYDNFANLDFENEGSFSVYTGGLYGQSTSNNEQYMLVTDGEDDWAPQHGRSAVYIGGTGSVSLWSGTTSSPGGLTPKDGDLISGTYWLKIMQEKPYSGWQQPKIRLYMKNAAGEAVDLAITKNLNVDEGSVWQLNPYTWTQMELESTGAPYEEGAALTWEITTTNQVDLPYMIDNVQFGAYKEVTDRIDIPPYTPYRLTQHLDFEDPSAFEDGVNYHGAVEFKYNDTTYEAASGKGAVYIDGRNGGFSFWGGGEIHDVSENSEVIGSFKFKLMQPLYDAEKDEANGSKWFKLPHITITKNKTEEVAYFDPDEVSVVNIGAYRWYELPIKSTGVTVNPGDVINYTVEKVEGSGIMFMLDDISIGSPVEEEEPVERIPIPPYTPYNLTQNLEFEDSSVFVNGTNYWCHDGVVDFKYDDQEYPAASGNGAVYIDGTKGSFTFWGGGELWQAPENSTVIGSFKFKLMQKLNDAEEAEAKGSKWFKLPEMTFTKKDSGEEVAYFDPDEVSVVDIGEYTWYELPIKSTGVTVNPTDVINYTIEKVEGSGIMFMLDDILIGCPIGEVPSEPGEKISGAAPKVNSYSGYNGDFESISGELPDNWGMWTSNQDQDNGVNAFNVIKDSPLAYSGITMIEAVRGGSMWSISADVSDKAGQLIGGSYMLYIGEDCDLTKDFPQVTVTYVANGETTTIAASPKNANEIDVVQGWNRIPILPSGTMIPENAERANLMIIAPSLAAGNPEYAGRFYIDNIDIGTIVPEIYVNDMSKVQVNDGTVSCDVIITNAETDEDITADVITAVYDDGKLIGISYDADTAIYGRGSSVASTKFKRNIAAAASGALKVSVMVWDKNMTPLTERVDVYGGSSTYSYDNGNIKYVGRWVDSGNCMSSNWGGAYFKTVFTGTSAALELKGGADIYVSIDGGEYVSYNPAGAGRFVVAKGLTNGRHTLKAASKYTFDSIRLAGITLDEGAVLETPEMSDITIEFIGDSNTAGYLLPNNQLDNYSWIAGEELGVEHVHIAYTGMALSDGIYNNNIKRDVGMSVMYDKTKPMDGRDTQNWDSTVYSPDLICVNLGANDTNETAVSGGTEKYKETLPVFLAHLKEIHPDAEIVVLISTSSAQGTVLHTVIPEIVEGMADRTINWFDANAWINNDMAANVLSDNVHLSQAGNKVVAENLSEIIAGLLGL